MNAVILLCAALFLAGLLAIASRRTMDDDL